jgi:hypothetical protein
MTYKCILLHTDFELSVCGIYVLIYMIYQFANRTCSEAFSCSQQIVEPPAEESDISAV